MANQLTTAIWLGCLAAASAGQSATPVAPVENKLPNVDVAWIDYTYSDAMDFSDEDGSLTLNEFDLFSVLSKPITVAGDVMIVPALQYGYTDFDFDNIDTKSGTADEDLHSVSLHLAAIKMNQGSPWFYGAWGRVELASDFQHINGDDFTYDVAAGVGYRVNDKLTVAAGAAAININGDFWVCPGINFDWVVNDQVRVGLYGPMPMVSYNPNDDWSFSLRGTPGGGIWNITDDNGDSKSVNLSSYHIGAFVGRRLTDKLWLNVGGGMTVANNLTYSDPDGDNEDLDEDMDSGFFGQIGLSLKAW